MSTIELSKISKKGLAKCVGLEHGWDSYDAEPPSGWAVSNAEEFLRVSEKAGLFPSHVSPSVVGGVGITFRHSFRRHAYVEFENDETASVLYSFDKRDPQVDMFEAKDYSVIIDTISLHCLGGCG